MKILQQTIKVCTSTCVNNAKSIYRVDLSFLLDFYELFQEVLLENKDLKRNKREIDEQNQSLQEVIQTLVTYTSNMTKFIEGLNDIKIELVIYMFSSKELMIPILIKFMFLL